MGRGETSDVSGIPTLNRLLTDIDEVKGSHTKVQTEFDDFKKVIDEKVDEEIRLVSTFRLLGILSYFFVYCYNFANTQGPKYVPLIIRLHYS